MSKHQNKINWVAVSMAVIGMATAVTETLRGRDKDGAHSTVTATQSLHLDHALKRIDTLEQQMDARVDSASERWKVLSDLRVALAKLQQTVEHLSEGDRVRARRVIGELEEMLEQPKRTPPKTKTIRIGPKTLKRPSFDPEMIQRRQQQLYSDE